LPSLLYWHSLSLPINAPKTQAPPLSVSGQAYLAGLVLVLGSLPGCLTRTPVDGSRRTELMIHVPFSLAGVRKYCPGSTSPSKEPSSPIQLSARLPPPQFSRFSWFPRLPLSPWAPIPAETSGDDLPFAASRPRVLPAQAEG
jgi:hypothetical protein